MPNEALGSCYVMCAGVPYGNLLKLTAHRSLENMTCDGVFTLSWPGAEIAGAGGMPVQALIDGARGTLMLDGQLAATFRIDSRTSHGSPDTFTLDLHYRGLASALVDSVPDHESGQENKKKPGQVAKKLAEGYESKIEDKSSEGRQIERFIIQEGESVERAIRRVCREFGINARENEEGNVVLEKKGSATGGGTPIILGHNFTNWSVKRDISERQSDIEAKGNSIPTDKKYGKEAEELMGEAKDSYVKFKKKMHTLIDTDHDKETLKKRAKTEMNRRKAAGLTVNVTMSTWSDDGGQLWKPGNLHMVIIPVDAVADMLQLKEVTFSLEAEQRQAELVLVPQQSFEDSEGGGDTGGSAAGGEGGAFS
jgi:prophage tail gpP-like protein